MDDLDPSLRLIVGSLAAYLCAHPFACDSAEGIQRWWFDTEVAMDDLMAALEWMQQEQLLEELQAADGHVRYRRLASTERLGTLIAGLGPAPNGGHA